MPAAVTAGMTFTRIAIALVLTAASACAEETSRSEHAERSDVRMSPEECEAAGGDVRANPGAGVQCEEGEVQIGTVFPSIEPDICCV